MTTPRSFDGIAAGEDLAPQDFHVTLEALVRYAAATWDFHHVHYDAAAAKAAGMAAPIMDGQMAGALLARLAMAWGGRGAFLRRLAYRQTRPVLAGERLVIHGKVSGKTRRDGHALVALELGIRTADGADVVRAAIAELALAEAG